MITNIGSQDIIFGLPWFKDYNPQIDFDMGKITIQKKAKTGWMRSLQSPTLSGQSPADYQRTTTELPLENYMNFHINIWWLFGGCLTRQLVQWTFQWTVQ